MMSTAGGKVSRLQVKEGKRNDGSKVALVTLLSETETTTDEKITNLLWENRRREAKSKFRNLEPSSSSKTLGTCSSVSSVSFNSHMVEKCEVALVPTHYEDPCTFWAQDCDDTDDILVIRRMLEKLAPGTLPIKEKPKQEKIYAAVYSADGNLCRCRVKKLMSESECLVHYIDFGNCECVSSYQIFPIPPDLIAYPAMAKRYRLHRLKPYTGLKAKAVYKEGIAFLKQMIPNDLMHCRLIREDKSDMIAIQVKINGRDLGEEVLSRDFAIRTDRSMRNVSPPIQELPESEEMTSDKTVFDKSTNEMMDESYAKPSYTTIFESEETRDSNTPNVQTTTETYDLSGASSCYPQKTHVETPRCQTTQDISQCQMEEHRHFKRQLNAIQNFNLELVKQRNSAQAEVEALKGKLSDCEKRYSDLISHHRKILHSQQDEILKARKQVTELEAHKGDLERRANFQTQINLVLAHLNQVRQLRKQISVGQDQTDPLENMCNLVQNRTNRVVAQDIMELLGINKAFDDYNVAQNNITDKHGDLQEKIAIRDATRITLYNAITQFVNEVCTMNLDERLEILTALKKSLTDTYGVYLKVKTNGSPNLDNLLVSYKDWKLKHKDTFLSIRKETNMLHTTLLNTWNNIRQSLLWTTEFDPLSCPHGTLMKQVVSLKDALNKELMNCSVEKIGGHATIAMIVQQVYNQAEDEFSQINEIKKKQIEYSRLITVLSPWLDKMPDFTALLSLDQDIKTLKSQLRHKLADLNDLEEEPIRDKAVMEQIKKDLTAIRNKLHIGFATGDRLSANFVQLSRVHYPELRLLYPKLDHELLSQNIVKKGRELSYYDVEPLHSEDGRVVVYKTRILDKDFILKEYSLDKSTASDLMIRINNYANLASKELVPITAILCPKDKRQIYIQMPFHDFNLKERVKLNTPIPTECKCKILINLAKAIATLHANNVIHGAIHPNNILITDEEAFLAPFNFSTNLSQRTSTALATEPINGLTFLAPELISNRKRFSNPADIFSLGCIALYLFYPKAEFDNDKFKIPNLSILEETHFLSIVSALLDKDPDKRMSADDLMNCQELQCPSLILQNAPLFEPICYKRQVAPVFDITGQERKDIEECLASYIEEYNVSEIEDDETVII